MKGQRIEKKLRAVDREADALKECTVPVAVIGKNELSLRFCERLQGNPHFWGLVPLEGEEDEESLSWEKPMEELIYLRGTEARIYCMSQFRDREIESFLLEIGIEPKRLRRLGYGTEQRLRGCALLNAYDPLLGFSRVTEENLPGFTVFTNCGNHPDEKEWKILTLGGSTSDPTLCNLRSWPEVLFNRLDSMDRCVTVYAGGIGGYTSAQEMKKLLRDGLTLQPDIVISYSGINDAVGRYPDTGHPFHLKEESGLAKRLVDEKAAVNTLQSGVPMEEMTLGVPDPESRFSYWLRNERSMHGLCSEFGIRFFSLLQPAQENYMTHNAFYREAEERLREESFPWLKDARRLFEDTPEVFYDFCHVYESGNRRIAQLVLQLLLREEKA